MNREQFFQELRTALHREGFVPQPEQDELLPVEWDGLPLCRITADGSVRYWQEDVATPERERACERATDLACTVREYMTLLEQAPPLQAQSLTGDYRLLADFNGAVLAAHPTRLGVQFVTWDWSFDRTGLNQGNYFQENYVGAKVSFSVPYMDEHIPTTGVCVEDANELAWAIEGMQCEDGELLKYLSVLSVEQPGTMQEALRCAMNLDDYERIPEDTYEYGQTVLRRIGADDELIDTIDGYMDFEKLGEDAMVEDGVRRTEFGLIRRCSSPFAEETQAMEMGGLS